MSLDVNDHTMLCLTFLSACHTLIVCKFSFQRVLLRIEQLDEFLPHSLDATQLLIIVEPYADYESDHQKDHYDKTYLTGTHCDCVEVRVCLAVLVSKVYT